MKREQLVGACLLISAVWGCSSASMSAAPSGAEPGADAEVAAATYELRAHVPVCNQNELGHIYYVRAEKEFYYCDGRSLQTVALEADPEGLVAVKATSAANCPNGGALIQSGSDLDDDGTLDANEVRSSAAVCNGVDGRDGADGQDGADGTDGVDGRDGTNGADGEDGSSCSVTENANGSSTIACSDGSMTTVSDGEDGQGGIAGKDGEDGQDGSSCTVVDNGDGTKTLSCEDGTSVTISDGVEGQDGSACSVLENADGTATSSCDDDDARDFTLVGFSDPLTFDVEFGLVQKVVLSGDVSASSIIHAVAGDLMTFIICQDNAGGHEFMWPLNVAYPAPVDTGADVCTVQAFAFDGTTAWPISDGEASPVPSAPEPPTCDIAGVFSVLQDMALAPARAYCLAPPLRGNGEPSSYCSVSTCAGGQTGCDAELTWLSSDFHSDDAGVVVRFEAASTLVVSPSILNPQPFLCPTTVSQAELAFDATLLPAEGGARVSLARREGGTGHLELCDSSLNVGDEKFLDPTLGAAAEAFIAEIGSILFPCAPEPEAGP